LSLIPEHPEALLGLSQVLQRRGDQQRAALIIERLLESALAENDDERASTLCMFLGDVWVSSAPETALLRYRRALELDSKNESAQLRIEELERPSELLSVLPDLISLAAAAQPSQTPSKNDSTLNFQVEPPEPSSPLPPAPNFLSIASQSMSSSPPPPSPPPREVAQRSPAEDSSDRLQHLIEIARTNFCSVLQEASAENLDESPSEKADFDQLLALLEEIIVIGTTDHKHQIYSYMHSLCEDTPHLALYSKILEHRIAVTTQGPDLVSAQLAFGEWLEFQLRDVRRSEVAYRNALVLDNTNALVRKRLQHLLVAQDRFEDLLDDLGSKVLKERLEYLLVQDQGEAARALQAARVLLTTIPSSERGQFWLNIASRIQGLDERCEALFEASHFDDVEKKQVIEALTQIDTGSSNRARATLLRTCISLEENPNRRVELRMALSECMSGHEPKTEPAEAPDTASTAKTVSGLDITRDSKHAKAVEQLCQLISPAQVEKLKARTLHLLEENKEFQAMGSGLIVQFLEEGAGLESLHPIRLAHALTDDFLVDVISGGELAPPLARLLRCTATGVGAVLPAELNDARIEMDEGGSELNAVLSLLRNVLNIDFRVYVDLESVDQLEAMAGAPPGIVASAGLLKDATEAELVFLMARQLVFIRLGGLLYIHEGYRPDNLIDWIEILYHLLDDDLLDRIPYEYAAYVERIRDSLNESQAAQIKTIRMQSSFEDVVNELQSWPSLAWRHSNRVAFLMTMHLGVCIPALATSDAGELEDLLDYMLGEQFAKTVQALKAVNP